MVDDEQAQSEHRSKMMEKYPSLREFEEKGDDYQESHDGREEELLAFLQSHRRSADFAKDPSLLLNAMDEFSAQHRFLISVGFDKARVLGELIAREKPSILIELGGYLGYSAILFVLEMRKVAEGRPVHVWSLEFEAKFAEIMRTIFALAGLQDAITVVTGPADESLRNLKASGKVDHTDVLFLDHVEDLYVQDFKVAMEAGLLKPGSCAIADNVVRPGAPEYVKYVRSQENLKSEGVKGLICPGEFYDELEVTKVL